MFAMKRKLLSTVLLCATMLFAKAQFQGCPGVSAGNNLTLPCGQTCTNLTATTVSGFETSTYTVAPTTYNPFSFNGPNSILINIDDTWAAPISLPFNFCFFGNTYNQVVVGSNGVISFNTGYTAGSTCQWQINAAIPTTVNQTPVNSIMGPWHDIDPSINQGGQTKSINWGIYGAAPCRAFVVSWTNMPMYSGTCNQNTSINATHQIVIYETTNLIDVFIQNKSTCASWNSGRAIEGIQNASGTVAVVVPGRNSPTQWTASNDAYRFTPAGNPNFVVNWFLAGNQIGTGQTLNVCPTPGVNTTYTAQATYTNCDATTVSVLATVDVFTPQPFTAQIDSAHNLDCFGDNSGEIFASVAGQPVGTTYSWSSGQSGVLSLTNQPAGTYIFTATDPAPNGCTVRDTVVVTQPTQLVVNVPDSTTIICNGPATSEGGIRSIVTGGTPGYTYLWSNGIIAPSQGNLSAGSYVLTATDANGCTASDAGQVAINVVPITFLPPAIDNVNCFGGNDGSIAVSVSNNAVNPVTYTWAAASGAAISNLTAGPYSVTATDNNGCSTTGTFQVTQPAAALAAQIFAVDITCNGLTNGAAAASVSGGTTPYSYLWSNGAGVASTSNLSAGPISLTVTDFNACTVSVSDVITEPTAITATVAVDQHPCSSPPSADITITGAGGSGSGYTYSMQGQAANSTGVFAGLVAGSYGYTVTDGNSCSIQNSIVVPTVADDVFNITTVPATCAGIADGSISIVPLINANGPYFFSFEGGALQPSGVFNNLAIGSYEIVAQNDFGCFDTLSVNITGPLNPLTAQVTKTDITCSGSSNGSAIVVASGGTPAYTYLWSNTSTATQVNNLQAGAITVTVTDVNGCTASGTATIAEPAAITGSFTVTNNFCGAQPVADAVISGSGGSGALTYSVNGFTDNSTGIFNNLPAGGNYNYAITDANGCDFNGTIQVPVYTPDVFSVNTSPATCYGLANGAFEIIPAIVQNGPYQYVFNDGPAQSSGLFANLTGGVYQVQVTNSYGCTQTVSAEVTSPAPISITVDPDTIIVGAGTPVQINVTPQGFTSPVYAWSPSADLSCSDCANPTGTFTQSGTLQVTASEADVPGCQVSANVLVVIISNLVLPNAFTPNGDNLNETFAPVVFGNTKIKAFRVYNRWGEVVYDGTTGWDGTYKGKNQPSGVYSYFIQADMPDKDNPGATKEVVKQGEVTILR
jgi:gliding motility-associated-like protein